MAEYLSQAWIDGVHDALSTDPAVRDAAADLALVIEQRVAEYDGGERVYHLTFDHGTVAVRSGPAPAADVTFAQDRSTALAVARGERSVHDAFMAGALRVRGDVDALLTSRPLFLAIDRALRG